MSTDFGLRGRTKPPNGAVYAVYFGDGLKHVLFASEYPAFSSKKDTLFVRQPNGRTHRIICPGLHIIEQIADVPKTSWITKEEVLIVQSELGEAEEYLYWPLLGHFWRRRMKQDVSPISEEGDVIEEGKTICVHEVMKVFSDIDAPFSCQIVRFVAEDGALLKQGDRYVIVKRLPQFGY